MLPLLTLLAALALASVGCHGESAQEAAGPTAWGAPNGPLVAGLSADGPGMLALTVKNCSAAGWEVLCPFLEEMHIEGLLKPVDEALTLHRLDRRGRVVDVPFSGLHAAFAVRHIRAGDTIRIPVNPTHLYSRDWSGSCRFRALLRVSIRRYPWRTGSWEDLTLETNPALVDFPPGLRRAGGRPLFRPEELRWGIPAGDLQFGLTSLEPNYVILAARNLSGKRMTIFYLMDLGSVWGGFVAACPTPQLETSLTDSAGRQTGRFPAVCEIDGPGFEIPAGRTFFVRFDVRGHTRVYWPGTYRMNARITDLCYGFDDDAYRQVSAKTNEEAVAVEYGGWEEPSCVYRGSR
jgi:hypothetical protein